jgi:chromate reductase
MNSIEAYIQFDPGLVTEDGEVTNEETRKFLKDYIEEFHAYIQRVYTVLPRTT